MTIYPVLFSVVSSVRNSLRAHAPLLASTPASSNPFIEFSSFKVWIKQLKNQRDLNMKTKDYFRTRCPLLIQNKLKIHWKYVTFSAWGRANIPCGEANFSSDWKWSKVYYIAFSVGLSAISTSLIIAINGSNVKYVTTRSLRAPPGPNS